MTSFISMFIWIFMAAILVTGVVMAVNGTFWLLIVGVLCFVCAILKYGILTH